MDRILRAWDASHRSSTTSSAGSRTSRTPTDIAQLLRSRATATSSPYTSDDKIVLDIGSMYTKVGFAGEHSPRFLIPNRARGGGPVGSAPPAASHVHAAASGVSVAGSSSTEGVYPVQFWDAGFFEIQHAGRLEFYLSDHLTDVFFRFLLTDPKGKTLIVCEAPFMPVLLKQTIAKVLFERFRIATLHFAPADLMTVLTTGQAAGLVVECGHLETTVTPVVDYRVMYTLIDSIPLAGQAVIDNLQDLLTKFGSLLTPLDGLREDPKAAGVVSLTRPIPTSSASIASTSPLYRVPALSALTRFWLKWSNWALGLASRFAGPDTLALAAGVGHGHTLIPWSDKIIDYLLTTDFLEDIKCRALFIGDVPVPSEFVTVTEPTEEELASADTPPTPTSQSAPSARSASPAPSSSRHIQRQSSMYVAPQLASSTSAIPRGSPQLRTATLGRPDRVDRGRTNSPHRPPAGRSTSVPNMHSGGYFDTPSMPVPAIPAQYSASASTTPASEQVPPTPVSGLPPSSDDPHLLRQYRIFKSTASTVYYPLGERGIWIANNRNMKLILPGWVRERAAEVLFDGTAESDARTVATIVLDVLAKCPRDVRGLVARNIVLSGGTVLLPGFERRFRAQIFHLLEQDRLRKKKINRTKRPMVARPTATPSPDAGSSDDGYSEDDDDLDPPFAQTSPTVPRRPPPPPQKRRAPVDEIENPRWPSLHGIEKIIHVVTPGHGQFQCGPWVGASLAASLKILGQSGPTEITAQRYEYWKRNEDESWLVKDWAFTA
ncbi:hypothetical protein GGF31_007011 [Allomyces arbusculus]|nr:hypothetical protein GGF31_007011 [Allomyces arbusculus]